MRLTQHTLGGLSIHPENAQEAELLNAWYLGKVATLRHTSSDNWKLEELKLYFDLQEGLAVQKRLKQPCTSAPS